MFQNASVFLQQFQSQIKMFYSGLTKGRRIALISGIVLLFATLLVVFAYKPTQKYELGYSNLTREDQTAILAFLKSDTSL